MNPNWTDAIEKDILALFIQDPAFAGAVLDELRAGHFSPANALLFTSVYDYYKKYGTMPSEGVLYDAVRTVSGESDAQFLKPTIVSLYRQVKDAAYVRDKVVTFINMRNLETAIRQVDEQLVAGDYEEARSAYASFREVGPRKMINFFECDEMEQREEAIPTGIVELDYYLRGGGHERGRLGIVLAGQGVGKSSTLVNIGAHDVRLGYRVLHVTAEDSGLAVRGRYDCRFAGKDVIKRGYTDEDYRLINSAGDNGGELYICEMVSGRCTPASVRAHVQAFGIDKPDVVIVDHIDVMRADMRRSEKRFELEDIAIDLRGIAQEFSCALWTGKQGDRGSRNSDKVVSEQSAEGYGPMRVADVVLGLARPPELKRQNRIDVCLDKQRDGIDGLVIACTDDRTRMLIRGMVTADELRERRNTYVANRSTVDTSVRGGRRT